MKTPESADCASSVALGSVIRASPARWRAPDARSLHLEACPRCCVFLRPDDDPAAVLNLLHPHQVVAIVARAVEAQLALQRVDTVLLEPRADRLVVQAVRPLDAGFEDLPRGVRGRGLRLDRIVRDACLRRAIVVQRNE